MTLLWILLGIVAVWVLIGATNRMAAARLRCGQQALFQAVNASAPCLVAVVYRTHAICPVGAALCERLFPDTDRGRIASRRWAKRMAVLADVGDPFSEYGINYGVRPFRGVDDYHDVWRFRRG